MLEENRKKYEQKTLILGKYCASLNLSPDILTIMATLWGALAALALWKTHFLLSAFFIILSGLFDVLDGATARYLKQQHPFGTVFDRVNDRYVEFFVILGCIASGRVHPIWAVFSLFGAVMASYVRACAESAGKVRNCSVGLMERKEKAALVLLGIILEPLFNKKGLPAISLNPFIYGLQEGILTLQLSIIVVGIFSHYTVIQRVLYAKKHENEISCA